mmetsp:Transcript_449/g.712  ORF Transcript_449/g.712 Transcript_449/m.712 type:complete len:627 (-) Transcript_449:74-1954(-)
MGSGVSTAEEENTTRNRKHRVPQRTESEYSSYPDGDSFTDGESTKKSSPPSDRVSPRKVSPAIEPPSMPTNGYSNGYRRDDQPTSPDSLISSYVADDEVKVNLAMADLMAYLQVVANNSQNLPLTRRDDPEVLKTVSSLTAEEYARKSAAFVPADVRVIAGSFTKYGRVWDLPTSDEFNAVDGAHEPGRSYGGACANAMLKVLYDAANEQQDGDDDDTNNNDGHGNSLFDDDDDDTAFGSAMNLSRDRTFQSLTLGDVATQSSITWSELLRKMKAEITEIEYAQAPTITSTRKFDLNAPFTLIPADFDESKNKKRSLLIGSNYGNIHGAELKASHDDIRSVKDYIVNVHGFPEQRGLMTVLLDDDEHKHPTHLNITEAFKALSEQSQPGDAVFVHFSGHGGRVLDEESYDEVIVPSDFQTSGLVRDTLMFKTLLAPMRYGVTLTILMDCCDTGVMLDLPYSWTTKTDRIETLAKLTLNDDFSFVRFLKVVKTLYEASTFTQLGRTVGSALNVPMDDDDEDDRGDDTDLEDDVTKRGTVTASDKENSSIQASFFSALTSCAAPEEQVKEPKTTSFVEKMINCTVGVEDDLSDDDDDDTRYTRDDGDVGTMATFETEEESYHHRRRRR